MNMSNKRFFGIFTRYLIILLSALFNLGIFYAIFTPLTVYPVYWIVKLFSETTILNGINIQIPLYGAEIELIPACIAGSAYFLLFILNMSVPNIKLKKRIRMIMLSFLSLLFLNVLRIIILILIYITSSSSLFDVTHKVFWYALSTLFVVGIWFIEVKLAKIKEIPIYSDIKYLIESAKKTKKSKHAKRSKKH